MSEPNESGPHTCISEELMDGYVLGRLDAEGVARVEEAIRDCPECRRRVEETRSYLPQLRDFLVESGSCIEDLELALFLDRSQDEARRKYVITHLAGCRMCLIKL